MSISRRGFMRSTGIGAVGALTAAVTARGHEALAWSAMERRASIAAATFLRLDSNENPNGPGSRALQAITAALGETSRYPDVPDDLQDAIAAFHRVSRDHVLLGAGSGEILRVAVQAFTRAGALVTGAPTFEDPARHAGLFGAEVRTVPVDGRLRLDLDGMARRAGGAGLVFLCNPNNPTGTIHGFDAVKDFITAVNDASAETVVLVDEAYHEYVEDRAYATAIPLALDNPRVLVSRTFSKVYGMAGLRVGYAIARPETISAMQRYKLVNGVNVLGAAAALASLTDAGRIDRERRQNREARELTRNVFELAGCRVTPSETNFIFVDIQRNGRGFQTACREQGVLVGRPFPPLTNYARVSIGTLAEMRQAAEVFKRVLKAPAPSI